MLKPDHHTAPAEATTAIYGMVCPYAEMAMQFLDKIGIAVAAVPGAKGFIESVAIVEGGLHVDPTAPASGLLHEAGHLAIVPARYRSYLSGDIGVGMKRIFEEIEDLPYDENCTIQRAMLQVGDTEATAWAWAAGKAIGIPEEMIIKDDEYFNTGESIRMCLSSTAYLGINGIAHAGFCVRRANPYRPLPVYPQLAFWLQP